MLNGNIFGEHFSQCANSCQVLQQQQVDQKKVYGRKKSGLISISKVFLNNCCSSIFGLSQTEIGRLFSLLGSLDTSSSQNNDLSIVRRLFSKPSKKNPETEIAIKNFLERRHSLVAGQQASKFRILGSMYQLFVVIFV